MSLRPGLADKILLVKQKGATVKRQFSSRVSYVGQRMELVPYNTAEYVALMKT